MKRIVNFARKKVFIISLACVVLISLVINFSSLHRKLAVATSSIVWMHMIV